MSNSKIDPQYQKMIEQIKIDEDEYCDEEMKPVYTEQKKFLDALNVMLGALFINFAADGLLKINASQKANIISEFDVKFKAMGKDLGTSEVAKVTDILSKVYKDTYYLIAYVMDFGLKADLKFDILKKEFIDAAVNIPMAEEMFSTRIWDNKASMIDKLRASLIDCMRGDTHLDAIAKDFQKTFNTTAYESQRLVKNESARVQSQASIDIAKNTGIKQHMWSATLDMRTNPEDASYDGNVYDINDDSSPQIPHHISCRCCWINLPSEDWKPTKRKDNETKEIIDYVDYATWLKDKNIED